jgi:twitching motility protein PilT
VPRLDSFLRLVVEQRASDLHFQAGNVPIIRHLGELVPLPFRAVSDEEAQRFLYEVMTPEQQALYEREQEADFAYAAQGLSRFRAHVFRHSRGIGSVFRVIPDALPTIDELGLPPVLKKLTRESSGLVLVTGPTGSGKTTTLAALVHEINRTQQRHILTIEDPIEFVHQPIQSAVTQRQVGLHAETFAGALRSALREAPDVIVIGEMRDVETVQLALSAAETGVLVFATLHTRSSSRAVDRIIDICPDDVREQARSVLSVLLKGVVAQHLCKRATGDGLIAVMEILLQTYAVSHMIRENKLHQIDGFLQTAEQQANTGMQSLDGSLVSLVHQGLIKLEDAVRTANSPEAVRRMGQATDGG